MLRKDLTIIKYKKLNKPKPTKYSASLQQNYKITNTQLIKRIKWK
jgi:hypothetical protein